MKDPVFIVGMPRSGTKLFRDLLNNHPLMSIPEVETHFLPLFIKKFGKHPDFQTNGNKIFEAFESTSFYWNSLKIPDIDIDGFHEKKGRVNSWEEFGLLVFSHFGPQKEGNIMYGDKTPGYINHLPLIKEIFPGARVIHLIRDPRDFCISVKNIWNKSMYRAADTWQHTLSKTAAFEKSFNGSYLEVKYEDVISDTPAVMQKVSAFLQIPYNESMTRLSRPAENYGAARGKVEILKDNQQKFLHKLDKAEVERIEQIAFEQMERLGYKTVYASHPKKLNKEHLALLKGYDAVNAAWFHIKEKGMVDGISYFLKLHHQSSWR